MRRILAILALLIVSQDTRADDIKDYVQYQQVKLRTYADAVAQHNKTKETIIVWVAQADDDSAFKAWQQTKDLGYHVYVPSFVGVPSGGVVVGRSMNGELVRYKEIRWSTWAAVAVQIKNACAEKIAPNSIVVPARPAPVQYYHYTPSYCLPGQR